MIDSASSHPGMPKLLLVASQDPSNELAGTVLYRSDVERITISDPDAALPTAKARLPNLVVIKDQLPQLAERLVRQLKDAPETRRAAVVVLLRGETPGAEMALRRAGASLVLGGAVDPLLWDDRLEELFSEPRRRDVRIPARYVVWPHSIEEARPGTAVNLSVRGMLLETENELPIGSTLEVTFELPGGQDTSVVGQVVREAPEGEGPQRYGLDFIILRGSSRAQIEAFVESEARL